MDSGMVRTEALAARERMRKVLMDTHLHLDAIEVDDLVVLALDTLNQAIRRLPGERRAAFAEALRGCLRELEGSLAANIPPRRAAVQTHANGADLKAAREHKVRQRALREVMARPHLRSIAYRRSRDGADHPLYGDGPRLTTRSSSSTAAPEQPPTPQKGYLEVQQAATVDIWEIAVVGEASFHRFVGEGLLRKSADPGYVFALVPVQVRNTSKKTSTFFYLGEKWTLRDGEDNEYLKVGTSLDTNAVPPGAARKGYLFFEVKEGVSQLFLELVADRWEAKWKVHAAALEGG